VIFTKVLLALCGTSLITGLVADGLFFGASRLLGGFAIGAKPSGWISLFGLLGLWSFFLAGTPLAASTYFLTVSLGI